MPHLSRPPRSKERPSLKGLELPEVVPFTKMHGVGNDYVYIDAMRTPIGHPSPLAVHISDRRFGVGGDGLVLIEASSEADFRMRIFNADGSEAEMCGNALRCAGKYVYEMGLTDKRNILLETLAGIRLVTLSVQNGLVSCVRAAMGEPDFSPASLPMAVEGDSFIDKELFIAGTPYRGTAVSMGNPHFVVPVADIDSFAVSALGPLFERHPLFPNRVNTEFVHIISPDRIRMRVWERGSGETPACGTGACAVLAACALNKLSRRKAVVESVGGELHVAWEEDNVIYMTGGATMVYAGEYPVPRT